MDPNKLINSFLGGGGGDAQAGQAQPAGGATGGVGGGSGGGLNLGSLAAGAALGGVGGFMLNSSSGRRVRRRAMRAGRTAAGIGGLALVGGLAYKAYSDYKSRQSQSPAQAPAAEAAPAQIAAPPAESGFGAASPEAAESLGLLVIHAMIAAANADGEIDPEEHRRIFDRLSQSELTAEEKGFLFDAMQSPKSIDQLAAGAGTPEVAMEVYAASVMAIEVDTPEERQYLDALGAKLGLEAGLTAEIEQAVAAQS